MTLKETFLQRSCSAELTAGKSPKNSCIDNLTNFSKRSSSCSRKLNAVNGSRLPLLGSNRNALNEDPSLSTTSRNKLIVKEKPTATAISSCYCSDCAPEKDIPKKYIEELEGHVQSLKKNLHDEKNNNQLLRRHMLVAKKVLEKEIGYSYDDFESLLKKAIDESWRGRQEIILALKRKLRVLSENVGRIENGSNVPSSRKKWRQKKEESPEFIPDERTILWCLELERQDVFKNADRHKQKIIESRDSMKEALHLTVTRNEDLKNEISSLRKKMYALPVNVDEDLVDRLHAVENKIKIGLEEKAESRRKLEDLEQQNCRNCRTIGEHKETIIFEKKNGKDQEAMLNSLKINEDNLRLMFEDLNKEKCKQAIAMKKQLDDVEKDYNKIVFRLDKTLICITDSKNLSEKLRKKNKLKLNPDSWKSCMFSELEEENVRTNNQLHRDSSSILSVEIVNNDIASLYQKELLEHQATLDFEEHKNLEKFKKLYNNSKKMKEEVVTLLKNRYFLEKLKLDTTVLKNRLKKFRKVVTHPSQQKLVKKKNSSQQLTETLDEGRMQLNILKTEAKFLKVLIRKIFSSKEDDFELFEIFLEGNKDLILKQLPSNPV